MRCRYALPTLMLLAVVAAACERQPAPVATEAPAATPTTSAAADNAFAVAVGLSPAAQQRLAATRETLIVAADYFGFPSAAAQAQRVPGSENPWLTLHRAQVELPGAGTARFPAVVLDPAQLAWTDRPDAPQVNINVYSGRKSSPDNLLDCAMFQDTLAVAARAPIRIDCKLIDENR